LVCCSVNQKPVCKTCGPSLNIRNDLRRMATEMHESAFFNAKVANLLKELIETEHTYVDHLTNLHTIFALPLLELRGISNPRVVFNGKSNKSRSNDVIVPVDQLNGSLIEFLRQIGTICLVNKVFCERLDDLYSSNADLLSYINLLQLFSSIFRIYMNYAQNYKIASRAFSMSSTKFHDYVEAVQTHENLKTQTLPSLLIMPLQRLPRYELFLREIKRSCSEMNKELVEHVIRDISSLVSNVNSCIL
jgi:hypothetical protein